MSLFGSMRTSISGMHAQSNRLSVVGDNIANASTSGYKRTQMSFSTMVLPQNSGNYQSGSVNSHARYTMSQQANISFTTSPSDLAIRGNGFFVVQGPDTLEYLTRAGGFKLLTTQAGGVEETRLVNAAGFTLMAERVTGGVAGGAYVPVTFDTTELVSAPTTIGRVSGNLDANADEIDPTTPGVFTPVSNNINSSYSFKSTVIAYNGVGSAELLDLYYTRLPNSRWEVTIYNQADAVSGGFPYTSGPLASGIIDFDPVTGRALAPLSLSVPVPNGSIMDLDLGGTTQLGSAFVITNAKVNGSSASAAQSYQYSDDGFISAVYSNGLTIPLYRLQLAIAPSPDRLSVFDGNSYMPNPQSGDVVYGYPGTGPFGKILSGGLEDSNVDIANELTEMIEAQRVYTSNSKVFQTGADMWEVLTNMKR